MTRILGVSAFHADASAVAFSDGRLIAGVEEERFRRVKHWAGFPEEALRFCLAEAGGDLGTFTDLAVSRYPQAYFLRKAAVALTHPRSVGRAVSRVKNHIQIEKLGRRIAIALGNGRSANTLRLHQVEHHLSHIGSAFFCSPFEEALCLSVDGFGDFVSTMLAVGRGSSIDVLERVFFPHSLGLFYTALTQFLGFLEFGDEYKIMGLAAYGEPTFVDKIRQVVVGRADGTFRLDLRYFRHLSHEIDMTWEDGAPAYGIVFSFALERLLGPRRGPQEALTQRHMDLAASIQRVYEERFFALVRALQKRTGLKQLTLAGGCALNSLANGKLFAETDLEEIYIQPAAGDAGTALGAALYVHHAVHGGRRDWVMNHCYWGPSYGLEQIRQAIAERIPTSAGKDGVYGDISVETVTNEDNLVSTTAEAIAAGAVVGWYQGRSEWGPRALGNRSILADPRRSDMKDLLNLKIKYRESFRPFGPSILEECAAEWFTVSHPDPFMIKAYPIRPDKRELVPAIVHVDGTCRLQTVSAHANLRYWKLIRSFRERTGVPILLNTSFNENEPIVNTPGEALDCFLRTSIDRLVLGDVVLTRR